MAVKEDGFPTWKLKPVGFHAPEVTDVQPLWFCGDVPYCSGRWFFLFLFSTPRRQSDKRQQIDTLARAGAKAETEVTSETDAQREDQMSAVLPRVPPPLPTRSIRPLFGNFAAT